MSQQEYAKYQEISKLYKEISDSLTIKDLPQVKLYLVNLEKRIAAKEKGVLGEFKSLKHLMDHLKEAKGKVPLHFVIAAGRDDVAVHLIEAIGVDHTIRDKQGNSPFFTAVEHGHLPLVRYFVEEKNCSVHETKQGQISALHIAANNEHLSIIEYLVQKKVDVDKTSVYGRPINWAVGSRQTAATKLLLEKGADPNGDSTGTNLAPLILAVDFKLTEIYKLLLDKGANVNIKDPHGYSVLHVAAQKGDLEVVKDLVSRGAEVNHSVEGKTPLYLAFEKGHWDVVNYFKHMSPDFEKVEAAIKKKQQEQKEKANKPVDKERAEQIKNIGNKFYAQKQYEQALAEYKKALQHDPNHEIVHRNMAACYLALNNYEDALVHCRLATQPDSKNVKTLYRESQAYKGLGDLMEASAKMWECCLVEPGNKYFRTQFQKLVDEARKKHQEQTLKQK